MQIQTEFAETEVVPDQQVVPIVPLKFNGIAIIGDMPYDGESVFPFSNAHYGTIAGLLRRCSLRIDDCLQTNVFPYHLPNNTIVEGKYFLASKQVDIIFELLSKVRPNVIILLGRQTLKFFKPNCDALDEERGAPFKWRGFTVVPTYHPRELYAEWHYYNIVLADYQKAVRYAREGWEEPKYEINYQPSFADCVRFLQMVIERRPWLTTDVETQEHPETGHGYLTCIGFAINTKKAFVIPFVREGNKPYFTFDEEVVIWRLLGKALEVARYLGQNAVHYDHWYLAHWCKILLNVVDDTMFAHWEVYTEMPKSLAFQLSLYTDNAYHKDLLKAARSGKVPRNQEFFYNGLDNIITLQSAVAIGSDMKELPPKVKEHYKFNIRVSRVFQYMSLRGARVDRDLLSMRLQELELEEKIVHDQLLSETGKPKTFKVTSPKQMKAWLYEELKLPVKYKQVKLEDGSVEDRESADFLSLMYLAREYPDIAGLRTAADLRKLKKRISTLRAIQTGPNGEIYWNFNLVGTETGRAAGYKPWNGKGIQPQNMDKRDRDLALPPLEGQMWGKCDLEGADSWTVAAQLAKLGDDTMLKDLQHGLKPAMILALAAEFGEHLIVADQPTLVTLLKQHKASFKKDERLKTVYDVTKAVSHGTNYMMQANTMHVTVFRKSKGETYIPVKQCEKLRLLYLKRYRGLNTLYEYIPTLINAHGYLDCPSGMRRVFFGRNDNHRTRVGLALIPQNNTAFATNRFLENLYYREYNRRNGSAQLIVEPLNQVHDEADLAFFPDELDKVRKIFNLATNFTSECWGIEFTIPFDPNYGPNWGKCDTELFA